MFKHTNKQMRAILPGGVLPLAVEDSQPETLIDCLMALQHRKVNFCQLRGRETGSSG